jgi:hypothetical protein
MVQTPVAKQPSNKSAKKEEDTPGGDQEDLQDSEAKIKEKDNKIKKRKTDKPAGEGAAPEKKKKKKV